MPFWHYPVCPGSATLAGRALQSPNRQLYSERDRLTDPVSSSESERGIATNVACTLITYAILSVIIPQMKHASSLATAVLATFAFFLLTSSILIYFLLSLMDALSA